MADEMVLKTQQWLNQTYGGITGYGDNIVEDGLTGWGTINALIRAFQLELGITETANNFGPTTIARFNSRFPNGILQQESGDETESNIYAIIQGACWCKGYGTGASEITKHFYGGTGSAISSLKSDAGCSDTTSTVTLNVMKALLSMDQFKVISGGNSRIRTIQQELNNEYEAYVGLMPCDGVYGRKMNEAMIKVLQAIEGYSVAEATGNFGSGTKANLPIIPSDGTMDATKEAKATKLVKYLLCCNNHYVRTDTDVWDSYMTEMIKDFQSEMCLSVTGICDTDTWMSLMLSKGNPDRTCTACDTRFEMTDSRLNYLKNNGYRVVGRYLTGGDFKELRTGEPKRILDNNINFFPIFQESSTDISYFTAERGKSDAIKAVKYMRIHSIPGDNIIYFAVDADFLDDEISRYILPYFEAIHNNIGTYYKVGVYGTRNVCAQVMEKGYAITCFVADMSTGYSGNMGYTMPDNWNLDQFCEIKNIYTGDNENMDLDKVVYSGKKTVVTSIYDKILTFNSYLIELENLYLQYNASATPTDIALGITNFLRSFKYSNILWYSATLKSIDDNFVNYVKSNNIDLYNKIVGYANNDTTALSDGIGGYIDIGHLAATVEGYLDNTTIEHFWLGWGGDLASLMQDIDEKAKSDDNSYDEIAKSLIAEKTGQFNYNDMCSDADAIKIAQLLTNISSNHPFSDAINQYYSNFVQSRYSYYVSDLNCLPNYQELVTAIASKIANGLVNATILNIIGSTPSENAMISACHAFAQYIVDNY